MDIEERKKLVIIGANDFQNQLILKAKEKGMETHVFAWEEGAVGKETADFFYPISIVEKEQIADICKKINPDGVASIASDLAAITVNYVAEELGLTGNGMESAYLATNKYQMRKAFEKSGDPSPKNYCSNELNDETLETLRYPLIVKPVDRSGSRGITKVETKEALLQAIETAKALSFDEQAIVEEYVLGQEYSVEYISYQGVHTFLALTQKYTTGNPHFIETGHRQPAEISPEMLEKVKQVVEHALSTLKIKNGASHSEIKIDEEGTIKIIEIGGRMGGDCIGSDLVYLSTGYDFVEMVIDVALGKAPEFQKKIKPREAEIHFILTPSDLESLNQWKKTSPERIYRISEIEPMDHHEVVDSGTRYGYYILVGRELD